MAALGKRGGGILFGAVILAGLVGGCRKPPPPGPFVPPPPRSWPVESSARLYRDDAATLPDTAIHKVLYDAIEFAQAWEQATAALDQPPSPHEIDFTQYMVVYVSAGRSDPGDQIQVDSVGIRWDPDPRSPQDYVEVRYFKVCIIREPNPFPGVSYPLELVRVNRWEGPVRWEWCGEGG